MRGRNCSNKLGMEMDKNLDKFKQHDEDQEREEHEEEQEETHLSGAYIRSLVKQLTSSRTKNHPLTNENGIRDEENPVPRNLNITKNGTKQQNPPTPPPPQQHKKQVRRRLHTSRPYQERLLNMAEARREIVTALKFHRASMKQANNVHQNDDVSYPGTQSPQISTPPPPPPPPPVQSPLEQVKLKSRRNPRIYAATTSDSNFPNYQNDSVSYSSSLYSPSPNYPLPPYWTIPPIAPPPPLPDNFNLNLPNQTLGLNLNFHDFNNLESTTLYHQIPPYVEMSIDEEEPRVPESGGSGGGGGGGDLAFGLHQAMDDEGMAEIRSLGEQHEMEWNDKMNLVTSAWWFKFLKTMEIRPEEENGGGGDEGLNHPLIDQVMEFPAWLNANDLDDYCSNDYSQDPALPCMDIGEIEGIYEEWLA